MGPCHDWLCSYMAEFFVPYLRKYRSYKADFCVEEWFLYLSMSESENRQLSSVVAILAQIYM